MTLYILPHVYTLYNMSPFNLNFGTPHPLYETLMYAVKLYSIIMYMYIAVGVYETFVYVHIIIHNYSAWSTMYYTCTLYIVLYMYILRSLLAFK